MRVMRYFAALGLFLASVMAFAASVNINTADVQTLADNLSGIGQAKAQAIVDYREAHGPFKSVDDLSKVKGIGSHTIDANRDSIEVDTPSQ